MEKYDLFLMIDFDRIGDEFCCGGNIKDDQIVNIVAEFLFLQKGKGEDKSEREEHDLYQIDIGVSLSFDEFGSSSNCGNKGLRDGILIYFLQKMEKKAKETFKKPN